MLLERARREAAPRLARGRRRGAATEKSGRRASCRDPRRSGVTQGGTKTFKNPFVQQHCAWPPLATPEASLALTRSTYSPGALNVAVVIAFPSSRRTTGAAFSNPTVPGPWCLNHLRVTGAMLLRSPATVEALFPSSSAQTVSASGTPTFALTGPA